MRLAIHLPLAAVLAFAVPHGPSTQASVVHPSASRILPAVRLLSVEDNLANQQLIHAVLERHGFQVHDADTVETARAQLGAHQFDMILLDINLPDGNGLELARDLKSSPATADVPIIVVSGLSLDSVRDTAMHLGCSDFVTKPIHPSRFVALLKRYLTPPG